MESWAHELFTGAFDPIETEHFTFFSQGEQTPVIFPNELADLKMKYGYEFEIENYMDVNTLEYYKKIMNFLSDNFEITEIE